MSDSSGTRTAPGAGLTQRQRTILDVIRASVTTRGYPPSIREIGDAVGLTSTSSVAHQLRTLERKGYLRRDPNRPRAVDVRGADEAAGPTVTTDVAGSDALPEPTFVPVLGRIAAGGPILAEEAVEDVFPLPRELVGEGSLFLLKVVGESMVDAAICDGDWVVVRQQNDRGQRRHRRRDDRRRGHREDVQAHRQSGLADAAQPCVRPDPRATRPPFWAGS